MRTTPLTWILLVLAGGTLAPRPGWSEEPLARVGGVEITSDDVERLRSGLPPQLRNNDTTWFLETLVTRELLIQEARRRGLDTTGIVRAGLERALVAKLRDTLFERAVAATVHASEQDLLEAFRQGPFAQRSEVRVAHIAVATREEAEALRARIVAGESFADLARVHSRDRSSAAKGGEIGVWRQGEVMGAVAEQAWSLEIGAVSAPVQETNGRFHLVTVLERRPVGFEEQRELLENRVIAAKIRQKRAAFVDSLLAAYEVTVDGEAVQQLLRRGRTAANRVPEAEPGDGTTALVRYRGGVVTLTDHHSWLLDRAAAGRRPYRVDRVRIEEMARLHTITERLYPLEARKRGLHLAPEVTDWARRKTEDLCIEALRRVAVEEVLEQAGADDLEEAFEDLVAHLREQHADQIQYLSRGSGK